jgi:3-oxoacyl-[acyl-carrier-protein] synthase-1
MEREVYIAGGEMISALGPSLAANMERILQMNSGVRLNENRELSNEAFYCAALEPEQLQPLFEQAGLNENYTPFEQIAIYVAEAAWKNTSVDIRSPRTAIILSTTKGNIDLLDKGQAGKYPANRIHLWAAADAIGKYFQNPNKVLVVSNACVSGVLAINTAASLIRARSYDHVLIIGADMLSKFVVSGFQSFQSLSAGVCKPFDRDRDGLNLGEAAGCLILTAEATGSIKVLGGSTHNDANHISGPSRTAEGFYLAARSAIKASGITPAQIQYISAHGTATPYNDEMEAIGIGRLGLEHVPVHSLKAFWGHTLGAAGVIEALVQIESMKRGILLPTLGCEKPGVSVDINISRKPEQKKIRYALKVASGFSGVNSSVVFENTEGAK